MTNLAGSPHDGVADFFGASFDFAVFSLSLAAKRNGGNCNCSNN